MAEQNKKQNNETPAVGETINKFEEFFQKNQKFITIGIIAIVVIVAGWFAIKKFVYEPKQQEAMGQMLPSEQYFRANNYDLALNGDGNSIGFKAVIDQYGTKAGKIVYFYAGFCELQLGNYEEAIKYLNQYNSKDEIFQARAYCGIGDAYSGMAAALEDTNARNAKLQEALNAYLKAAKYKDNMYAATYYKKVGIIYEELGQNDKAIEAYTNIKENYPGSIEAYDIDKYISKLQFSK